MSFSTYFIPFPKMAFSPCDISLSNLYQTPSTRSQVRGYVSGIFLTKFEIVIQEAKRRSFRFVRDALDHKQQIQTIFVEYGMPLESLEDLKLILATLPEFSELRKQFNMFEYNKHEIAEQNGITEENALPSGSVEEDQVVP